MILLLFSFIAGIVTILSPCVLPVLPIVLAGSAVEGKRRPLGIIIGFIVSFTLFTLFLTAIVKTLDISPDILRTISIIIVAGFGVSLLIPQFQTLMERLFAKISQFAPRGNGSDGFGGGILLGLSLGLLWTPCVGPILASVIALAATATVTLQTFLITLSYSLGTSIPMFGILIGGRQLLLRNQWLLRNSALIQKIFGILMILTAIGIFFNFDRKFQTFVLEAFPKYGTGLTSIEQNTTVLNELNTLKSPQSINTDANLLNVTTPIPAPSLLLGGKWFNLPKGQNALTLNELKGKVVLVDFWTYTCINCIRTLPHLKDWYEKYKDSGLVIIGVHTPEFAFEHDASNVSKAISDFGITYPVMQDNDYATWNNYSNQYWPAEYLIDKDGKIRRTHFGEGEYDKTEMAIQLLLKEAGNDVTTKVSDMTDETPTERLSPETYIGSSRMEYYFPSQNIGVGSRAFTLSESLPLNSFSLGGNWNIQREYSVAGENASLNYRFQANKVFLVLRPGASKNGTLMVTLDGKPLNATNSGSDVINGIVTVDSDKLYNLIDLKGNTGVHTLKLEFKSGIEVFAFTFG